MKRNLWTHEEIDFLFKSISCEIGDISWKRVSQEVNSNFGRSRTRGACKSKYLKVKAWLIDDDFLVSGYVLNDVFYPCSKQCGFDSKKIFPNDVNRIFFKDHDLAKRALNIKSIKGKYKEVFPESTKDLTKVLPSCTDAEIEDFLTRIEEKTLDDFLEEKEPKVVKVYAKMQNTTSSPMIFEVEQLKATLDFERKRNRRHQWYLIGFILFLLFIILLIFTFLL
jgi:hypothetical protein